VGETDTYRSTLLYACMIAGGEAKLAERLGVRVEEVVRWMFGKQEPPLAAFLVAVEIVLKERAGTLEETREMLRVSKQMLERTREHSRQVRESRNSRRGARVLLVHPVREAADALITLLAEAGHEASAARDGPEALAALSQRPADVVIVDIGMPGMTRWELGREMRQALGEPCPVLVAVTGLYVCGEDKALAQDAGFAHTLYKPCDPKALLALLARLPRQGSADSA